ncbi:beta-lactamase family protein [Proteobacteria bacterium 005FR1]|nr:beta-lactamase family protein [Proteobacteria bacterium 005FR1]
MKHLSPITTMKIVLPALLCGALLACGTAEPHQTRWPAPPSAENVQAAGFSEEGMERLDAAMRKVVDDQDTAGMVWLLARNGEVATYEAHGLAAVDTQTPMTRDTLFRIYSMTKPITGVAMMILHEEGLWDFDDPISKHIPEFANLQVLSSDGEGDTLVPLDRQPTMRELLNHTAGFGYGLSGNDAVNQAFRDKQVLNSRDLDELVAKVAGIPLISQPGEQWYYSIAVDLQGYIVQKLSGQPYGDFLEERIFQPLQMVDTRFYVNAEDQTRFAEVHNWDKEQGKLVQRPHRTDRPSYLDPSRLQSGGGGLVSSTADYARFLQMLVNEGELEGKRVLSPESVKLLYTDSLPEGMNLRGSTTRPGQPGQGFGIDFAVVTDPEAADTPQGKGTYYWGGAAGTWFWIDPTQDMFWIGMIQHMGAERPDAADMREIALDIIYQDLNR